ncbi:MAG: helix-turn-helix transcriptional regulator [Halarchaeum sp.]
MTAGTTLARLLADRAAMLRPLRDGPRTPTELATRSDVSRSTVDRVVRAFVDHGALERRDGAVALTLRGRLALDAHDTHVATLERVLACDAFVDFDPNVPLSFSLVRTADVVTAADDPLRISTDLVSLVERATHVEMYTSVLLPDVVDAVADRVTDGDLTLTVYVDDDVVSSLLRDYDDVVERVLPSEAVTLATVPDGHPFDVAVYTLADGERVAAVVFGTGAPAALLLNSSQGALAWASERLDAIADRATPLT